MKIELTKEEVEKIQFWCDSQDWLEAVLKCGATAPEEAAISYRFAGFSSIPGAAIDKILEDTQYRRVQQSIYNIEAPILDTEK